MTRDLAGVLGQAGTLWRRDRAILLPVSGLFVFLPQYAVLLLIPAMPQTAAGASMEAWGQALEPWLARYGGWYVLATVIAQFGALASVSLYAPPVPAAGAAIARALRLFPRALLASILVALPCGAAAMIALPIPLAPLVVFPLIVYALARTALAGPVILGETGTGAVAAIARSWALTRGRGLGIALLVGAIMIGGQALGAIFVSIDRGLRAAGAANPIALALVDALAAGAVWAAALALALVQVVLYRRLAR